MAIAGSTTVKVLFLNPPFHRRFSREQRSPAVTKSGTLYYPKWLATAAGVALRAGHEVDLVDAPAKGFSTAYVIQRIERKGIRALVCDTSTPSIVNDLQVIKEITARLPNLRVLLVGRHVSVFPAAVLAQCPPVEAVALREYEFTALDWLNAVACGASLAGVQGLAWRDPSGNYIQNDPRPPLENLDELPFATEVYRRFLDFTDYFYSHTPHPLVVFDTSRGCPFHCNFCVYPQTFSGHTMRYRSVGNVVEEFRYAASAFPGLKAVMLEDDTFIIDKRRTLAIAEALVASGNRLQISANCRPDIKLDLSTLQTLRRAGFRLFCVGFESADPGVVASINRTGNAGKSRTYHADAEEFVRTCQRAGLMVHGCFMFGHLDDTRETLQKTLNWAMKLDPDTAQFFPLMVYPGTAAYESAKERGWLTTEDYSQWLTIDGSHNSVVRLPQISAQELVRFCDLARRRFYLRPKYIWRKTAQSLRSADELKRNAKGFLSLAKHLARGSQLAETKDFAPGSQVT
jgi:radical SAM superfamily enzyme YgiQ (UPF0313 family)